MSDRAVFFDVDGVVVHGFHARADRRRRWDENLAQDLGIDPAAFTEQFICGPFQREVLTGRVSLVQALTDVLPKIGYHGSPMQLIDYWLRRDSQLNLQLLDLISALRRVGVGPIYLATNQEHLRAFHLWTGLGLNAYFDDIFYAARLGALKPAPAFFEGILRSIGKQAEPPLFFDDSEAVVAGVREFGWEGVLFDQIDDCAAHPWIRAALDRTLRSRPPNSFGSPSSNKSSPKNS
jgi:putative hydrolase of the HAD superfamily